MQAGRRRLPLKRTTLSADLALLAISQPDSCIGSHWRRDEKRVMEGEGRIPEERG